MRTKLLLRAAILGAILLPIVSAQSQDAPPPAPQDAKPKPPPKPIQKEFFDFENAAQRIIVKTPASEPWKSIGQNISAMRREVLEDIYRLVGLTLPEGKRVEVVFQSGSNGTWGFTQARSWGALIIIQLSRPQGFVNGERPLFQHEMMHALQNAWIENHLGRYFPDWIFEGVATYVGGHGPHKLRESVARSGPRMINGLGRHSFGASSDYAEGYLAFLYLEHLVGEGAVKTFVRDITIQRTPWKESLKKMTNMEFEEFAENAKQFSLDYIAQVGKPRMSRDKLQTEDVPPPQLAQKQDAAKPDEAGTPAAGDDAAAHPAWRTFGLALQSVDRQAIRELKLSANAAFMVVGVDDESAGAKAGVEVGDVVVSVNGASVENAAALQPLLDGAKAGTEFKLEIFRSGKKISTQIVASGTP